jgi:hypothetical protein
MKTHEKVNLFLAVIGFLSATAIGLVGLAFAFLQIHSNNLNVICREPWWDLMCKILLIKISPTPSPSITPRESPSLDEERKLQNQKVEQRRLEEQLKREQLERNRLEDQKIQKLLDDAKTLGDSTIDRGRLATTTNELKEVERMLVDAIDKLNQVPRNPNNSSDISSKLKDYESALAKVRNASAKVSCNTALFGNCVQLPLSLP